MIETMTGADASRQLASERAEHRHDANIRRAESAARRHAVRYYRRLRSLPTAAGEYVDALTTRYGFGLELRHPHGAYYADGIWYRIATDGRDHIFAPISDTWLSDLHIEQTTEQGRVPVVRIHVVAGVAVEVVSAPDGLPFGGDTIADESTPTEAIERILDLGRKRIGKAG